MKKVIFVWLCLLNYSIFASAQEHPVIYMVSSFRSISTAFLKMMHYRGDFKVLNEPSHAISVQRSLPQIRIERPDCYPSLDQAPKILHSFQERSPVFVKDVVAHFYDLLEEYPTTLFQDPQFHWVILVRDPAEILLSFYKVIKGDVLFANLYSDRVKLSSRIGIRELHHIFDRLVHTSHNSPKIMFTDQISEHPESTIEAFCMQFRIPYSKDHLAWKAGELDYLNIPSPLKGEDKKWVDAFLTSTIKSTHFGKMRTYKRNEWGEPTFEEVQEPKLRALFHQVYQEHKVYYDKLREASEHHLIPEKGLK